MAQLIREQEAPVAPPPAAPPASAPAAPTAPPAAPQEPEAQIAPADALVQKDFTAFKAELKNLETQKTSVINKWETAIKKKVGGKKVKVLASKAQHFQPASEYTIDISDVKIGWHYDKTTGEIVYDLILIDGDKKYFMKPPQQQGTVPPADQAAPAPEEPATTQAPKTPDAPPPAAEPTPDAGAEAPPEGGAEPPPPTGAPEAPVAEPTAEPSQQAPPAVPGQPEVPPKKKKKPAPSPMMERFQKLANINEVDKDDEKDEKDEKDDDKKEKWTPPWVEENKMTPAKVSESSILNHQFYSVDEIMKDVRPIIEEVTGKSSMKPYIVGAGTKKSSKIMFEVVIPKDHLRSGLVAEDIELAFKMNDMSARVTEDFNGRIYRVKVEKQYE